MSNDDLSTQAKKLLEQKMYAEAGKLFHALWDEVGDAFAASRYLFCLRKAGHSGPAVEMGRKALLKHNNDQWIRREFVWALYEHAVKPAKEETNLNLLLQAAEELMAQGPEDLPRRLTVMAVVRVAKNRGRWDVASSWCDLLTPEHLDDTPREIEGRQGKSDRETWYFSKIKCLIELSRWEEAFALSTKAAGLHPREANFRRWAALARAGQGNLQEAISRLEEIVLKERAEWYLLQDLCELYLRLGDYPAALRNGCRAALDQPDDKLKVSLYVLLCKIGLANQNPTFATEHLGLARLVRERESWSIPAEFGSLESEIQAAFAKLDQPRPTPAQDVSTAVRRCRSFWHDEAYRGLPRVMGTIEELPADRPFGWIRNENGDRIFVLQKDLSRDVKKVGLVVNVALEPSWDRKRELISVRAVDVQSVGAAPQQARP